MQHLLASLALGLLGSLAAASPSESFQLLPGDDVQAAIDAAQPGDVIEFLEPSQPLPETLVITRGITLLGTNFVGASAMFLIRDVPAGEAVVLQTCRRIALSDAQFESPGGGPMVRVENCAGSVLMDTCYLVGRFGQNALEVENASVILNGSRLHAGGYFSGAGLPVDEPGYGATAVNARLYLDTTVIRGGSGGLLLPEGLTPVQKRGAEAVVLQDSSLVATRSSLEGGSGAPGSGNPAFPPCLPGLPGRPAILGLGQSTAQIAGGDSLTAGNNGLPNCGSPLPPVPKILGFTQPGASIETGNAVYSSFVSGNSTPSGAFRPGDPLSFLTIGSPGQLVFHSTAGSILPPATGVGGFGLWLGNLPNPVQFQGAILGAGLSLDLVAPELPPGSSALQVWFQSALVDPSTGAVRFLSPLTAVVVP